MAKANRRIENTLILHSDQGVQYACSEFRSQLMGLPIIQSMSRKGNCWDNAVAESFLKTEMVYRKTFKTKKQAYLAVFEYIQIWYNRKRIHSTYACGNKLSDLVARVISNSFGNTALHFVLFWHNVNLTNINIIANLLLIILFYRCLFVWWSI